MKNIKKGTKTLRHSGTKENCRFTHIVYKFSKGKMQNIQNILKAFTLAEVLVTLVIIGVISALTIPTITTNYQKKQTVVKLKKVYNTLQQAINRAIADYGTINKWDEPVHYSSESVMHFIEKYIKPYVNIVNICDINKDRNCSSIYHFRDDLKERRFGSDNVRFDLPDGTMIFIAPCNTSYCKSYNLAIDINGRKAPNLYGKDIFSFVYNLDNTSKYGNYNLGFPGFSTNRGYNLQMCKYGRGELCTPLIIKDNWQISSDYPW